MLRSSSPLPVRILLSIILYPEPLLPDLLSGFLGLLLTGFEDFDPLFTILSTVTANKIKEHAGNGTELGEGSRRPDRTRRHERIGRASGLWNFLVSSFEVLYINPYLVLVSFISIQCHPLLVCPRAWPYFVTLTSFSNVYLL